MKLSSRVQGISPSMTLAIDEQAKAIAARGESVVSFGAGEPDYPTPKWVMDAARGALDMGYTRYTPVAGIPALREAICLSFKRDYGLDYVPQQIVVSNGAKHSLYNIFTALLDPGDEVIIPAPYWLSYPEMIRLCGGKPVFVHGKEGGERLLPGAEEIEQAITDNTRAIVINNPSNPTGEIYSREILEGIADVARRHDLVIVSDEIYSELTYDGIKHVSVASLSTDAYERTIVINGVSKTYSMTGWRIGYTASCVELARAMTSLQSQTTSNANSIAQHASVAALLGPREALNEMVAEYSRRRDYICGRINSIDGLSAAVPGGAFYVMMKISGLFGKKCGDKTISDSLSFAAVLLENAKVAVVPGVCFGADGYVRLSYATSMDNIQEGLDRIEAFVGSLS